MKRRRLSELTGGTGDVSPQFFNMTVIQPTADTLSFASFPIPVQRLETKDLAQVMEVLAVFFDSTELDGSNDNSSTVFLSTSDITGGPLRFDNPKVIAMHTKFFDFSTIGLLGTNFAAWGYWESHPTRYDMTDGDGHGVLVATDNLFITMLSNQTMNINRGTAKILYRWKNVSLAEYIGIVQSQQ